MEGLPVVIHGPNSGITYIPAGDSYKVGSLVNEFELHVRGTLTQEDGVGSTTFANSHRLFVMNGGELEIHAPITGGFRGLAGIVLGGGTLSGRVDINSHRVSGSGTIESTFLGIEAGSSLRARGLCDQRFRANDTGPSLYCIRDGQLVVTHTGGAILNEGLMAAAGSAFSGEPDGALIFAATVDGPSVLNVHARPGYRGTIRAEVGQRNDELLGSMIRFVPDAALTHQNLEGDGFVEFTGDLIANDVRVDTATTVRVGGTLTLDGIVRNDGQLFLSNGIMGGYGFYDPPLLINNGQLNLQSSGAITGEVRNDGDMYVARASGSGFSLVSVGSGGRLDNLGTVTIGNEQTGGGTLRFEPGSTFSPGGRWIIEDNGSLEFEDGLGQWPLLSDQGILTNVDLTMNGGSVLIDGQPISAVASRFGSGSTVTLGQGAPWIALSDLTFEGGSNDAPGGRMDLHTGSLNANGRNIHTTGCNFGGFLGDAHAAGCGAIRGFGEISGNVQNDGMILAHGAEGLARQELVLNGPVDGSGWFGAGEGGLLNLNQSNLFHPGSNMPSGELHAQLHIQEDGQIVLSRAIAEISGSVVVRNRMGDGGISYADSCSGCTDDHYLSNGFFASVSRLGENAALRIDSSPDISLGTLDVGAFGTVYLEASTRAASATAGLLAFGEEAWLIMHSADPVLAEHFAFYSPGRDAILTAGDVVLSDTARIQGSGILGGSTARSTLAAPITASLVNEGQIRAYDGVLSVRNFGVTNLGAGSLAAEFEAGRGPGHLDIRTTNIDGGTIRIDGRSLLTVGLSSTLTGVTIDNAGQMGVIDTVIEGRSISRRTTFASTQLMNSGRLTITAPEVTWRSGTITNVPEVVENNGTLTTRPGRGVLEITAPQFEVQGRTATLTLDEGHIEAGEVLVRDGLLTGNGTLTDSALATEPAGSVVAAGGSLRVTGMTINNRGRLGASSDGVLELSDVEIRGSGLLNADSGGTIELQDVALRGSVINTTGDVVNPAGSVLRMGTRTTVAAGTLVNEGVLRNDGEFLVAVNGVVEGAGSWLQRAGQTIVNGVASFMGFRVDQGDLGGSGTLRGNITLESGSTLSPGLGRADAGTTNPVDEISGEGLLTIAGNLLSRAGSSVVAVVRSAVDHGKLLVTGALQIAGSIIFDVTQSTLEVLAGFSIGDFFKTGSVSNPQPATADDVAGVVMLARTNEGNVRIELDGDRLVPQGTADVTPPVVSGGPAVIVMDATGPLTLPDPTGVSAVDDVDGPLDVFAISAAGPFVPGFPSGGPHVFFWGAGDAAGNFGVDLFIPRQVTIRPLAGIPAGQRAVEGENVGIEVRLSGPAASYPVSIDYVVSGTSDASDHDLADGTLSITEGTIGTIPVAIAEDASVEGVETLIVTLTASAEAALSTRNTHEIQIHEGNLPPRVQLGASQGGIATRLIVADAGLVTVTATAVDPNGNGLAFDWSASDSRLAGTASGGEFTFDPAVAGAGLYRILVTVTDDGSPTTSTTRPLALRILNAMPAIVAGDDTDGDGVADEEEGSGDSDGDGVPDYRDPSDLAHVLPAEASFAEAGFMRTEPGLRLKLGTLAFGSGAGGASIDVAALKAVAAEPDLVDDSNFNFPLGVFDFVVENLAEPGDSVALVLPLVDEIPTGAVYLKFDETSGWREFVEDDQNSLSSASDVFGLCPEPDHATWEDGLVPGRLCLRLVIQDGGPNDTDDVMDGRVEDPGAVASAAADTDEDTMPDDYEDAHGLDKNVDDADLDADGDGLTNLQEFEGGTHPQDENDPDVHAPVLTLLGDDPLVLVVGGVFEDPGATAEDNVELDGIVEVAHSVDVDLVGNYLVTYSATDTSGNIGTLNRTVMVVGLDTDNDLLPDLYEIEHGLNPDVDDAGEDADLDGLTNLEEFNLGLDPTDADTDDDTVIDGEDAFPNDLTEAYDTDADGMGNNYDMDDDGDGVYDEDDAFPLDGTEVSDIDEDGIGDVADLDDDNDGVPDLVDVYPHDTSEAFDTDGDGIGNNADVDDDNDGVVDEADALPLDSTETRDSDGDGTGDNADADDDNDGVPDVDDLFPLDSSESADADGDGVGDAADTDDDNDGVDDAADAFPLDPLESSDNDNDGIGDAADTDDDNDGIPDVDDPFPLDSNASADTDGDGVADSTDTDDDNDGVDDDADAFPLDAAESADTDGDGTGDNADSDDDNDGVPDTNDPFPLDASESADADGDGVGDVADPDDDNDGVDDAADAFPLDAGESVDTDGDGIGNVADDDDDGDGLTDVKEVESFLTNPLDADSDDDGLNDGLEILQVSDPLDAASVEPGPGRTSNLSTRGPVLKADDVLIGGFIVDGETKQILVRVRGPSLADFGVSGVLNDPIVELYNQSGELLQTNDNWQDHERSDEVDSGLQPTDARESIILATLPAGGYTAVVRGVGAQTGIGIVEVFEHGGNLARSRFANISTRGFVGTGDDVLIGGLIVEGHSAAEVTFRARAQSMADAVPGLADRVLADVTLQVFDVDGNLLLENDDWESQPNAEAIPGPLRPTAANEAAIRATLMPGAYTAIVRGKGGDTGLAIVEIFTD